LVLINLDVCMHFERLFRNPSLCEAILGVTYDIFAIIFDEEEEGMVVDGGYAGIPGKNIIRKQRGKLSSDDIIWNNKIEAVRVVVENQFKSIKDWDICGEQFRCKASRTRTLEDICLEHHQYCIFARQYSTDLVLH
jgi:hypothetical protein